MKISIVIPVYNVAPWIEGCLRSVFEQGADSAENVLECIVVDDCGTDGSMKIVESLAPAAKACGVDFHIVSHIHNRGLAAARNTGTAVATGDYIFYIDGDDSLEPRALANLAQAAACADYPDWVQGNYRRVLPTGEVKEETSYFDPACPIYTDRTAVVRNFDRLNFTNAHNKLIRTDFIRDNGLAFHDGLIYEDVLWCMQAYGVVERIATLRPMTYRRNFREGSIMRSAMTEVKLDSLLYIVRQLAAMPRDTNVEHRAVFNAVYGMKNLYMGPFGGAYRRQWMAALWETGVPHMEADFSELQPLSRLVARALRYGLFHAKVYLRVLLWLYGLFLRIRRKREE
ncbi:glycosyltransferase family 2 protein [uncultured Rikenella sp.]|uniref:glycosyltransferase family 2 protein n=1 Tax=uncultured Rikenella sp. TaxID=368003 RepID=UPI00261BD37C|nr:glycosyltransferase family 2 protein [uncultured Rikenella sp.]